MQHVSQQRRGYTTCLVTPTDSSERDDQSRRLLLPLRCGMQGSMSQSKHENALTVGLAACRSADRHSRTIPYRFQHVVEMSPGSVASTTTWRSWSTHALGRHCCAARSFASQQDRVISKGGSKVVCCRRTTAEHDTSLSSKCHDVSDICILHVARRSQSRAGRHDGTSRAWGVCSLVYAWC